MLNTQENDLVSPIRLNRKKRTRVVGKTLNDITNNLDSTSACAFVQTPKTGRWNEIYILISTSVDCEVNLWKWFIIECMEKSDIRKYRKKKEISLPARGYCNKCN